MVLRAFPSPVATFNRLVPKDRGSLRAADGLAYGDHPRRRIDLYRPRSAGEGPLPVILFFYGGSWASGRRQDYAFAGRALAAGGFLAAVPDYRLVPEGRFPGFLEDGAAAFRWLRNEVAQHGGDPDRIVLVGHSAGAYIAAMLALDERWLGDERAAVRGLVGLAGPYDFLPLKGPATEGAFGHVTDAPSTQPITHARAGAAPALLLHGEADRNVAPRNSRELARALSRAGGEVEALFYPGRGHAELVTALALPFRRRVPVLADLLRFARRVCG